MNHLRRVFLNHTIERVWKSLRFMIIALYASRVAAEYLFPHCPLAGTILGAVIGLLIGYATRTTRPSWPAALLVPAVLFPFQSPELALLCGVMAGIAAIAGEFNLQHWAVEFGVFVVALLLFGLTLAPGVQPADGGEFQLVLAEWGVAHPPGYPLYTMLGGLFARLLPLQEFAWRINLFSAVTGALTLAVIARTVRLATASGIAGILASGVLGSAAAFWTTSTQASIRPLTALFMALMIAAALRYQRAIAAADRSKFQHGLVAFGLAIGFGVTHHASLIFPGVFLALMMVAARPHLLLEWRRWVAAVAAALAGVLPWGYLVVRGAAGARLAPSDLATWDGLWRHVLASGFAGDMLYYRTPEGILTRLGLAGQVFAFQWQGSILTVAIVALVLVVWRDRWTGLALWGAFAVHTFIAATYRAPQTVEYLIPAYVCLAYAVGMGLAAIREHETLRRGFPLLAAVTVAGIVWSSWPVWISLRAAQQLDATEARATETLQEAEQDGVVLANWHTVTPLWVVQAALGLRSDVTPTYVAPAGNEPILDTWARLIKERAAAGIPVVTCSYYPETFQYLELVFASSGPCWKVLPQSLPAIDSSEATPAKGDIARLLTEAMPAKIRAGERLTVDLTWELVQAVAYGGLTGYVHLLDEAGALAAQSDQPFMAPGAQTATRIVQRHTLYLPRTLQPGRYTVTAGVYGPIVGETQSTPDASITGQIEISPSLLPPVTLHSMHTPLDDALMLVGYDYDFSVAGRARLYLHWQLRSSEQSSATVLTIFGENSPLASVMLASSAAGGFVTTTHDIPDGDATRGVRLTVVRDGMDLRVRGAWQLPVQAEVWLPPVRTATHYVPVGDIVVTEYMAMEESPNSINVSMTIRSLMPQDRDITLKFAGSGVEVNAVPLAGMLPSLKWGWNSTIRDTITVSAPGAQRSALTVTFYDAFTSATWPIFDPVLGQESPALTLTR